MADVPYDGRYRKWVRVTQQSDFRRERQKQNDRRTRSLVECFAIFLRWLASSSRIRFACSNGHPLWVSFSSFFSQSENWATIEDFRGDSFLSSILYFRSLFDWSFSQKKVKHCQQLWQKNDEWWGLINIRLSRQTIHANWRHTRHERERERENAQSRTMISLLIHTSAYARG